MPKSGLVDKEIPVIFQCKSNNLFGILHEAKKSSHLGVLIVVGGPQYRVGSHRQFVLLARFLAENGFPVMRFDYRGMGDSTGSSRAFSEINEDIACAIEQLYKLCPEISGVVIWGLCDAASAALFYAHQDVRVKGLILLNPWVYSEQAAAKTYIKHYYLQRIASKDFWRKMFDLKFNYLQSLFSLINTLAKALQKPETIENSYRKNTDSKTSPVCDPKLNLPSYMLECLLRFKYPVLLILSGNDFTADEFRDLLKSNGQWAKLINESRVTTQDLEDADHTFSKAIWRNQVSNWTLDWIKQLQMNFSNDPSKTTEA